MEFDLANVVNAMNNFLIVKDQNFKHIYCNEALTRAIGFDSSREVLGKTNFDLYDTRYANLYQRGDSHVLSGGILLNVTEKFLHASGSEIQLLTNKNQVRNKEGEVVGVVVSSIDITGHSIHGSGELMPYNEKVRRYEFRIEGQKEYFTGKEYIVFKYLLLGQTTKKIAYVLNLSPRTIESHVEKIKYKLQCTSKFHIAETAIKLGLLHQNLS